ncbi:MAG TPA: DUF3501 domain-containing protein [Gammaproteobacteria bacterium]|nr:DUF3501 domain-containing protein [Gammaproteobacteria bacterium]
MALLTRDDLYSLERYAEQRVQMRAAVMQHKKNRQLPIGPHATLYFEDSLTMQYQIQEMLRVERIFEADAIQEELDTYNPLIPDGSNWKATFMIEYTDVEERQQALAQLVGIEQQVWMQVQGFDPVYAIADEDLERADEEKTSAVHFLRFEITVEMVNAVHTGADINAGIDHHNYTHSSEPIPRNIRDSLARDLS